jgi:flavodoxin
MSKSVVVYVTRTGHARILAEELGRLIGAPVAEIGDEVRRDGFFGYFKTGFQASTRKATPIRDPGLDLSAADCVILVEPVWASSICPPLRTWLRAHAAELKGKRIGLLVIHKGSPAQRVEAAYLAEFGTLSAFTNVLESESPEARTRKLAAFAALLGA